MYKTKYRSIDYYSNLSHFKQTNVKEMCTRQIKDNVQLQNILNKKEIGYLIKPLQEYL